MSRFTVEGRINAPKQRVWEVLAEIGDIHKWNPGVSHSYATSDYKQGEGATRHCDLHNPRGYLEERAFDWREGDGFKIDIYASSYPLKRNVVQFSLREQDGGTVVSLSPDYDLQYGVLGALADRLFIRRKLVEGMRGLVAGLKYHVETGELVGTKLPEGVSI